MNDSRISMKYTFLLIHNYDGHSDTLDKYYYFPSSSAPAPPKIIHTASNTRMDSVYLKVVGVVTGMPDDDTMVQFQDEQLFGGSYPVSQDSNLYMFKKGAMNLADPSHEGLNVLTPFPNPVRKLGESMEVIAAFPKGFTLTAEVFDLLGRKTNILTTILSDGLWQEMELETPKANGMYYLRVSAGGEVKNFPFVVSR
jgi:hypothetical protein